MRKNKYIKEYGNNPNMNKMGKIFTAFTIRLAGAIVGSVGFFVLAYQQTILGTALVGIGTLLIATGGG